MNYKARFLIDTSGKSWCMIFKAAIVSKYLKQEVDFLSCLISKRMEDSTRIARCVAKFHFRTVAS